VFYWFINQSINQQISLPSDCMNRNHIKTDKICICSTAIPMQFAKAQYTAPTRTRTRLNSTVASRQRRRCVLGIIALIGLSICLCYHICTATTLSQHLVPRDSESPAVPSKFHNLGRQQKKFWRYPQTLDEVSATGVAYNLRSILCGRRSARMERAAVQSRGVDFHPDLGSGLDHC